MIADKVSNLRSLAASPPPDRDAARRREDFEGAARAVEGCRGVHSWLEEAFDKAHREGLAAID